MTLNKVPKKKEKSNYSKVGCAKVKGSFEWKELYKLLHGREGTKTEVGTLSNRFNSKRANPGFDIFGLCVEKFPHLKDMTLGEFFDID